MVHGLKAFMACQFMHSWRNEGVGDIRGREERKKVRDEGR